jgi:hypothetical protein
VCRYEPVRWRKVLEGIDSRSRADIENAMDRVSTSLANGVAHALVHKDWLGHGLHGAMASIYQFFAQDLIHRWATARESQSKS